MQDGAAIGCPIEAKAGGGSMGYFRHAGKQTPPAGSR
jgi:hypothetical protein